MKQYVIDQLRPSDYEALKDYLDKNYGPSNVPGIYWIQLDQNLLTQLQSEHTECQPFYFAVNLKQNSIASEFLIRTLNKMRCSCINYADEKQRSWIIQVADTMLDMLKIKI